MNGGPDCWSVRRAPDLFKAVRPGQRWDLRSCTETGAVPVLDQSRDGFIGYHNGRPSVSASPSTPVITFANHTCAVRWVTFDCSAIQNVFFLRAAAGVDDRFLYYSLDGRVPQQSYQGHWPILQEQTLGVPPLPEQRQIAEILDTLDEAIRKTEAIIEKLKQVKQGMLHDLLTRGIDHNGELRDPERHPEQFKDSTIGKIPNEWGVSALGALGVFMNGLNKPKHAFGSGTLFVNISDVYPERLDCRSLGRMETTAIERNRFGLRPGDIVLDRSSVKLEGVGYPTVYEGSDEPVVFCGFIIRFRPTVTLHSRFLCEQMRSHRFRAEVIKVATQVANVNVNQRSLSGLLAALPSQREQSEIVRQLDAFGARISDEHQAANKLRLVKQGLMQDLLTGRVRVTNLLEEVAE